MKKKSVFLSIGSLALAGMTALSVPAAGALPVFAAETAAAQDSGGVRTTLPQIDMTKWQYNEDDDVYWQVGLSYCATPADASYETMGVFVPGAYFTSSANGDGTYTCSVNAAGTVSGYTAETAPLILPVNTPGYAAMSAPTSYDSSMGYGDISDYTSAGFVVIFAGARGRDAGAPAGVTDFKAAIRYTRYNAGLIPGDMDALFVEGMSGGGAQSALLGTTGDSALYDVYLDAIGAVRGVSDAVAGSMCWCPITNLDSADMAYEWNMGNTRSGLTDEEQTISDLLTKAYAAYINRAGFRDADGNVLSLEASADGRYQAGSYYTYVKSEVERSLNNFLSDTTFPYDSDSQSSGGHGGGAGGRGGMGERPDGDLPAGGGDFAGAPDHAGGAGAADAAGTGQNIEDVDQIARNETTSGITISGTYETAQDYIDALNADGTWVSYDAKTNTAAITSLADFTKAVKPASKDIGAFDELDAAQGENTLFGYNDGNGAHFDAVLAEILEDTGSDYADAYNTDLGRKDAEGVSVTDRLAMYTPLYYLLDSYRTAGTDTASTVAKYWRIRTGAWQSDTSITTEINLALALQSNPAVQSVDFETVWGMKHTEAERTGDSTDNFIAWVNACMGS